jgi:hypothetical protein
MEIQASFCDSLLLMLLGTCLIILGSSASVSFKYCSWVIMSVPFSYFLKILRWSFSVFVGIHLFCVNQILILCNGIDLQFSIIAGSFL